MIKRRYHLVFKYLRPFFRLYGKLAFRMQFLPGQEQGLPPNQPALLLANHNSAFDPFFMAQSFRRPIFYVASDHIFRLGWISAMIKYLVAPIPIVKAQMDLRTLRTIREIIADGGIVGLFPEGNRSFSGMTTYISPSIGKLAKQLKCTILLYQFHGGYLSTPRWARSTRKGQMSGQVVRRLDPDEIAALSPDELSQIICSAIQVDAFAEQLARPVAYQGRRLAEHLELALFVCPKCRRLASLYSRRDRFGCSCGLDVRYTEYGFFEPVDPWSQTEQDKGRFLRTVADWDQWQKDSLPSLLGNPDIIDMTGGTPLFADQSQRLYDCERARRSIKIAEGTLALFADRLDLRTAAGQVLSYRLKDLSRMIVHGPKTLQFTTLTGQVLEVRSKIKRSAYKYMLLFHILEQNRTGDSFGFFGI